MPQIDSFANDALSKLPAPVLEAVLAADLPGLGDGPENAGLVEALVADDKQSWGSVSAGARQLALSGLWLLAGDLDRSHTISQDIGSAEGSFWHGIMHRREGDFGNSKYWFRRVGSHPVLDELPSLSDGDYDDPFDFVDACSRAVRSGGESEQRCLRAQWVEWQALMTHCLD